MKVIKIGEYPQAKLITIDIKDLVKVDFALCRQPRETLENYYNRCAIKPTILINGGFFNMANGETVFTYRDEGKDIMTYTDQIIGFGVSDGELAFGEIKPSMTDFVSGYPVLIYQGGVACDIPYKISKELDYNARRTILGYSYTNVFILLVENPGLRFKPCVDILLGAGCDYAINLDGGGSTRCLIDGYLETSSTVESRPVDNVVGFYLKDATQKDIYRVQVGAFGVKSNAEKKQQQIRGLVDNIQAGYRNAYVRYYDKERLYKVQVGAFAVKSNAEKVLADLKSKGHVGFITIK